jgi:hypothetical protein
MAILSGATIARHPDGGSFMRFYRLPFGAVLTAANGVGYPLIIQSDRGDRNGENLLMTR